MKLQGFKVVSRERTSDVVGYGAPLYFLRTSSEGVRLRSAWVSDYKYLLLDSEVRLLATSGTGAQINCPVRLSCV